MSIIKRKRGNVIYIYEQKYIGIKDGKRQYKETCLGHLDEAGNLIPSEKNRSKAIKKAPAELVLKTTTKKIIVRNIKAGQNDVSKKTDKELIQDIENSSTSFVNNITLDLNKISQIAFSSEKNITLYQEMPRRIAMEARGSKKEINTLVSINFDTDGMNEKGKHIKGTEKLTPFDRIVLDAVNTLYFKGNNEYITTSMVFHVMAGNKDKFMSPKYAEEINNSLIKLLFTHITIDASEEASMYPELKNFKYHSTFLPGDMVQAKLNGTEVACIHIYTRPILYLYAKHKKQVSEIDIDIIQKPFLTDRKESKEQMTILYYLLRRIIALKSLSNIIKYETLYREFGYVDASRKEKFRLRERIKRILDSWKGAIFGDIKFIDYTEAFLGRAPQEIIINYEIKIVKQEK